MGKILGIGVLLLLSMMIGCSKKSGGSDVTSLNATDQQFVTNAGYNNVDEINAGYQASTNASDSNVRSFALSLVNNYGSAQSALVLLADSFHFTVVSGPDPAHETSLNNLSGLSGLNFDTTYLRIQINDDQAAISLYQAELSNGQNAAVKAYANNYLPAIQAHLNTADNLITIQFGH
jgi:putative membrane protein